MSIIHPRAPLPGPSKALITWSIPLFLLALPFSPLSASGSAGTVWDDGAGQGFGNGDLNGTVLRTPDGAVVLDRGDLLGPGANWSLVHAGQPSPRRMGAMAYDPVNGVSVLFSGNGATNDTWVYNCSSNAWSEVSTSPSPSPRYGFALAYDSRQDVMVLFGGASGPGNLNDTWTYNVTTATWAKKNPRSAPSQRYSATMAYDPDSALMVLFGGYSGGYKGDTWVYNLTEDSWTERTPAPSPSPRIMHSMAYFPPSRQVVLSGGLGKGDLWTYDVGSNTWKEEVTGSLPSARSGALMAYDDTDGIMVLFGGFGSSGFLQDTWVSGALPDTWTRLNPSNPPNARDTAAGAYDSASKRLVLFGGQASFAPSPPVGDTWTFSYSQNRWTATIPTARWGHAMAAESAGGATVLFGGRDILNSYKGDTWVFDAGKKLWTSCTPATSPPPRCLHSMTYDTANGICILFGGQWPVFGDTWTYKPETNAWSNVTPAVSPSPRFNTALAYDPDSGATVLFGGSTGSGRADDTWTFNSTTGTWLDRRPPTAPSPRVGHAIAYDRASRRVVLFGGNDSSNCGDTWTYELESNLWTNVTPPDSPSPRMAHTLVYDEARGVVLLFGGRGAAGYLGDTWAYSTRTNSWVPLKPSIAPGVRGMSAGVYDRALNQTLVFGGNDGGFLGDLWSFPVDLGYRRAGEFASQPHDSGGQAYFGSLSWEAGSPPGTGAMLQLRTSEALVELGGKEFVGPDGSNSTYYTVPGERIWSGHNGSRWMQYRALLSTIWERETPVLFNVGLRYNRLHVVTLYSPSGGENWLGENNITWIARDPDGDSLTFDLYLSRNGGVTYPKLLASGLKTDYYLWNTSNESSGSFNRIKVVARDDNASIPLAAESSSGANFTISRPNLLPASELLYPPAGSLIRNESVALSWSGNDPDGDELSYFVVLDGVVIARVRGTVHAASGLAEGMHRWTVIPNDGFGNGTCRSGKWNFTVSHNQPPVARLRYPLPGSLVRTNSVELAWSGEDREADELSYVPIINGKPDVASASTARLLTNLTDGDYSWSVVPADALGEGTCLSGTWNFTVKADRAPSITLLSPASGSAVNTTEVELRWSGADPEKDPLTYILSLTDGKGLNLTEQTTLTNRTVALQDRTTYTWRVTVSDGILTATSPTYSFSVKINHRPVILSRPATSARAGQTYVYQVTARDEDGDQLRFSLPERPEGMTVDGSGKITWKPSGSQADKEFRITVVTTDGFLEDRQEFTVKVSAAETASLEGTLLPWAILAIVMLAIAILATGMMRKGRGGAGRPR